MKKRITKHQSPVRACILSAIMCLFLIMGTKAPIVQASDSDTDESSLQKFDALIQGYANTDLIDDPKADTYKPSEYNEMKRDLDLYLCRVDISTKEKEMKEITRYVSTRTFYNEKDKRYSSEGTELTSDNPYDVWTSKKAVCKGYSNLLTTLMHARGIPSIQIISATHAYNVCYNADTKRWIYIDPTVGSLNRYTLTDEWKEDTTSAAAIYNFNNCFDMKVSMFATNKYSKAKYYPYSVPNLKKDGIYYSYRSCASDYNTGLSYSKWKNTENWFMSIVKAYDTSTKSLVVDTDNIGGIPITRIYAGFAGTNIESVDLSKTALKKLATPTTTSPGSFEGCTRLKTVKLPDTITYMDIKAFKDCTALEEINMPKSLTEFTSGVFSGCTSLTKVDFTGTNLTSVGSETFKDCTSLQSVIFGKHEKMYIGISTFTGCTALETVDCTGANINSISEYAFYKCSSLKKLDFSDSTFTTTGQSTFRDCSTLKEITFPASLQEIEAFTLDGTAIETLDLTNTNVKDIDAYGCMGMKKMCNLYLPRTLKTLGDCAFAQDGTDIVTRVYSELPASDIRKMAKKSQYVWSGRTVSYPQGSYTIVYDGNGADSGKMADEIHPIELITFNLTANTYTKEGYTFVGWNTKADGSGQSYKDQESIRALADKDNATVTLYAIWKENKTDPDKPDKPDTPGTYTITYELTGGTNHADNPSTYTSENDTIELKAATRKGYIFLGWFLDDQYTKQIDEIPKGSVGDVTLYAKWEEEDDECQHEWMNGNVLEPSTCVKKGSQTRKCMICDKTEIISIPKDSKNHVNTEIRNKKEATATTDGYTGDTYCKDCKRTISRGKTIPKTGSSSNQTQQNNSKPGSQQQATTQAPSTQKPAAKKETATSSPATEPDSVEDLKPVNKKGNAIKITWTKQTGVKGYEIQYALNKKFTKSLKTITVKAKASSKTIKKLKFKKTYYVRIRSFTKKGNQKIYGEWSSVKKVKIKQ